MNTLQQLLIFNYDNHKNNKHYLNQLKNILICPYCLREVPNKEPFYKKGCKWCQLK